MELRDRSAVLSRVQPALSWPQSRTNPRAPVSKGIRLRQAGGCPPYGIPPSPREMKRASNAHEAVSRTSCGENTHQKLLALPDIPAADVSEAQAPEVRHELPGVQHEREGSHVVEFPQEQREVFELGEGGPQSL